MNPVAVKSKTTDSKPITEQNLQVKEARTQLPDLVRTVESSPVRFTIGKRGARSAMVVSYQLVKPLFDQKIEPKLALIIVQESLGDAPLHLSTPAVAELSGLSKNDLFQILNALPFTTAKISDLKKSLEQPKALDRLIRRIELAKTIANAQDAGLYETVEHLTSEVSL